MTSQIDICNQALDQLGTRSTITSLTEESVEAKACARNYDSTLEQLLRAAPWGFCKAYVSLGLLKSAPGTPTNPVVNTVAWTDDYPPPPWLYEYNYPEDCIFARFVIPNSNLESSGIPIFSNGTVYQPLATGRPVRFAIGSDVISGARQRVILTNQSQAILCYTSLITDPDVWDPSFLKAMINALAGEICISLTGDKTMEQKQYEKANLAISEARKADGNEALTVIDYEPDWIRVRGTSWAYSNYDIPLALEWGPMFGV